MGWLLVALLIAWILLGFLGFAFAGLFWLLKTAVILAAITVGVGWVLRTIKK